MHKVLRGTSLAGTCLLLVAGLLIGMPAGANADSYSPHPGLRLASPVRSPWGSHTIFTHIIRSIDSAPKGSRIRIASWNMRSPRAFRAAVDASNRGVSVQIVIDRENANPQQELPNPGFFWMQRELRKVNKSRPPGYRSYAKTCAHSCRGKYGIAHTKMFLFSKAGHSKWVVMYGSFNLTDAAAKVQWNDTYTTVGRKNMYDWAMDRWAEMARDRPMQTPWRVRSFGPIRFGVFPYYGPNTPGDPVMRVLNQVKCFGATAGAGNGRGRTVIRIAQTSEAYARGERIARKLKSLWNEGCDIKMIYAILGARDKSIYADRSGRGAMPVRQLAQDFDGDWIYDRYLHTKILTISGVYGNDTSANYSWNGSANWEAYVLASDDTFARIDSPGLLRAYNNYINYWFNNRPASRYGTPNDRLARMLNVDPYQKIEVN